jgi:ABC-type phosphate transport system permease subunit
VLRSAALGGVFIGVLSGLPFVSAGNCCCCMWMVSGGALAAYLEIQQKNRSLTAGEGAALGALSGVIGAFVWIPIAVALAVLLGPLQRAFFEEFARTARDMPPEVREILENFGGSGSVVGTVFGFIFQLFAGTIFAAVGGVLSAAYFKKEVPPAVGGDWVPPLPQ